MRRRALLSALAATTAVGLAGCTAGPAPGTAPESTATRTDAPTTAGGSPTTTRRSTRTTSSGPTVVRCRGDPVSAERSITDEPGYDDEIEYFPGNDTVRFVAASDNDGPVRFGTWTFEEWGTIRTAEVAASRAHDATVERLNAADFGSGWGQPPESAGTDSVVAWLFLETQVDDDGEPVRTPRVELPALVDAAPRSVHATVSLDGDEFSRTVPVFAEHARALSW